MTIEELQDITKSLQRGEYVPLLNDLLNGKAMIVDTEWLEQHDKQIIDKAWGWISEGTSTFDVLKEDFYNRMINHGQKN